MAVLREWNAFQAGVICGVIGSGILIIALVVWRKMEHKTPIHLSGKVVGIILLSIVGALALGIGMSLAMVWSQIIYGVIVGLIGIVVLMMLIPICKGIQ